MPLEKLQNNPEADQHTLTHPAQGIHRFHEFQVSLDCPLETLYLLYNTNLILTRPIIGRLLHNFEPFSNKLQIQIDLTFNTR